MVITQNKQSFQTKQKTVNVSSIVSFVFILLFFQPTISLAQNCDSLNWQSPWQVAKHTLKNGLQVILVPQPERHSVFFRMHVNVGSIDEKTGQAGFAHLFEHLMFKGSQAGLQDGDFAQVIRAVGGEFNATTHFDYTSYYAEIPTEALEQLLWLEQKRFSGMDLNQSKLKNQVAAVLEEKAMRIDNQPYVKPAADFFMQQMQGTPYAHLVIGNKQDLKAANLQQVEDFFQQYYVAKNMTLVLVGDFDHNKALNLIQNYLSDLPAGEKNTRKKFSQPKSKAIQQSFIDPLIPLPAYGIAWHTPNKHDANHLAVEAINKILLDGEESKLKIKLEQQDSLIFFSYALPMSFDGIGIANLGFIPRSFADFDDIKTIVDQELDNLHKDGIQQQDWCLRVNQYQSQLLDDFYQAETLSLFLAERTLLNKSVKNFAESLLDMHQFSLEQVNQLAKQYFHHHYMVLQIKPTFGLRLLKSLAETLPRSLSEAIEEWIMQ